MDTPAEEEEAVGGGEDAGEVGALCCLICDGPQDLLEACGGFRRVLLRIAVTERV